MSESNDESASTSKLGGWLGKRHHKNLGEVFVTFECLALQLQNPDPTSIFVEHNGEIKEVSRSMMTVNPELTRAPALNLKQYCDASWRRVE